MKELLVITGPTASGKSDLALFVARLTSGEVISADSIQVYKELNIGSAKPSDEVLREIPHHLISAIDIEQGFNAGAFRNAARSVIHDLDQRKLQPILVGGTGLYIKALLQGLIEVPEIPEDKVTQVELVIKNIRASSDGELEFRQKFHSWLSSLDPKAADSLNPNDLPRMQRAAVVFLSTGNSILDIINKHKWSDSSISALVIVLCPSRRDLYSAIDTRVDRMIDSGLVDEVEGVLQRHGLRSGLFDAGPFDAGGPSKAGEPSESVLSSSGVLALPKALNSIGYRHACMFLNRKISFELMVELIKRDTRRFAKHQLTWWRNEPQKIGWQTLENNFPEARNVGTRNECLEWGKEFLRSSAKKDGGMETTGVRYLIIGSGLEKC